MDFRFCPRCAAGLVERDIAGDGGVVRRLACPAPSHAVVREVKEELDLDVVEVNLVGNYIFKRKNEVMLCYHAVAKGTVRLGAELAEYRRYKPENLRPWKRATGHAVADWMRSRGLAFEWDERPPLRTEVDRT